MVQRVKHLPAVWETQVRCLGWEDPLEKEMATHSGTLAWKIPWTEKPGHEGHKESDTTEHVMDIIGILFFLTVFVCLFVCLLSYIVLSSM